MDERRAGLIRVARQSNLPLLTRHFDGSMFFSIHQNKLILFP